MKQIVSDRLSTHVERYNYSSSWMDGRRLLNSGGNRLVGLRWESKTVRFQRNYYEVFGVPRTASLSEIRERYLDLVRQHHPDRCRTKESSERLFTQLNVAYQTLRDSSKREAYDLTLAKATPNKAAHGSTQAGTAGPAVRNMAPAGGTIPNIDPGELYKKADSAFLRGDVKEARCCCDEIIAALPNEPLAHQLLGDLLADQGKYEDALKAYYVALIEFPSSRLLQVKIERAKMALQAADKVHAEKSVSHPTDKRSLFGLSKGSR